jgi:hypothetical protein
MLTPYLSPASLTAALSDTRETVVDVRRVRLVERPEVVEHGAGKHRVGDGHVFVLVNRMSGGGRTEDQHLWAER